jgi:hypothetical protein
VGLEVIKPRTETRANSHRMTIIEENALIEHLLDIDRQGILIQLGLYVEWHIFYFASVQMILPQPLVSTGYINF